MSVTWSEVPQEVLTRAAEIIRKYHPDLEKANVAFVFRSEPSVSGNKFILGHASKVTPQYTAFLDYDFIIWISELNYSGFNDKQRDAIIDHELCHCTMDEIGKASMVHHDIEEFDCIIQRYGFWKTDLVKSAMAFGEQAQQLSMIGNLFAKSDEEHRGKIVSLTGEQLEKLTDRMPPDHA